jgi:TRAP-type C4-dicarboxylate transport system permease small subunit
MKSLLDLVEKVVEAIVCIQIFGILVVTLMQVVSRYVFNSPYMWTEELARALGIWLVLLCSGIVVREHSHLGFDILPEKWKPIMRLIANVAIIFFAVSLFKGSIDYVMVGQDIKSSALQIPLKFLYFSIPTGLFLMFIYALENTKNILSSLFNNKMRKRS